ncbi:MAG: glucose dehydrogenase [Planctomycetaceae bacterium]|nr:glucose dehydrogenase [Planctomycetaceae bacterium]
MGWLKNLFVPRALRRQQNLRRHAYGLRIEHLEERLVPASLLPGFTESIVASGLNSPTTTEFSPDGKLFITEQRGTMEVWQDGTLHQANFFRDTPIVTDTTSERGLLGVTFDPNYASDHFVYVYYTTAGGDSHNRVSRFTADATGELALAGSEQVIWEGDPHDAGNHNGGAIHFGPDGKLYIATGDDSQGSITSQSLASQHGKILRINADGTIPSDNPFYDGAGPSKDAIWALGLRNPFTFTFQPGTGRMFIGDVGQSSWEEIDEGGSGRNFGWGDTEGNFNQSAFPNFTEPFYAYSHDPAQTTPSGNVLTGGAFYSPAVSQFPSDYQGDYFFADVGAGWIYRVDSVTKEVSQFADFAGAVDLKVTADGGLYYLSRWSDKMFRITYSDSWAPAITEQPEDVTVGLGQTATFSVEASGSPAPSFQWQRSDDNGMNWADIAGATSKSLSLTPQLSDSQALFRARATNGSGTDLSQAAQLTVLNDHAPNTPVITIDDGLTNGKFTAGQSIHFVGSATDPEDGNISGSNFTWTINYLTSIALGDQDGDGLPGLTRPFDSFSGTTSGSFTPATIGPYNLTDVGYAITLTAHDAQGLTSTQRLVVEPNTATITLLSNLPGAQLTLDTQPTTLPHTVSNVVGFLRPIGAPLSQTINGITYDFVSWSDGGAAQHSVTSALNTTYTATYVERVNLALHAFATSSTNENDGLSAANAVDGDSNTRWSSKFTNDEYLQIDLGAHYDIHGVLIHWENAYGKRYSIEVSDDGDHWEPIYTTPTDSDGGFDDLGGLHGAGQYVRMQGLERSSPYGYSLFEMEVYGTVPVPSNLPPTVGSPAHTVNITTTTAALNVLGADDGGESNLTYTWSVVGKPAGAADPTFSSNGTNSAQNITATFSAGGTYTLLATIQDAGGLTVTSTVDVTVAGPNLALGKLATASSAEDVRFAANNVVDDSVASRWSSQFSDNQWVQVDLGASYKINQMTLNWERAFGKRYRIDVSTDGETWSTIYTTTSNSDGGIDDLTGLTGVGRFVRLVGLQRDTPYGYSLFDMAVYGSPTGTGNQAPNIVIPASASLTSTGVTLSVLGDDDGGRAALAYTWSVSAKPAGAADPVFSLNGTNAAKDTIATFAQGGVYSLQVTVRDANGATVTRTIDLTAYGPNLALGRPTTASSVENGGTVAANATDGNTGSRWSSKFTDDQWLQVDLGAVTSIGRVRLNWEAAYGKRYRIDVSDDGVTWQTIYTTTADSDGGIDDLTGLTATGRYVRMVGLKRASQYGYSLWDLAVYGSPN